MDNPETRQTLVLLSGLLCDEIMWHDVARELNDITECTIFSFAGFNSIKDMADHVLENSPASFSLAGHSMGGRVALEVFRKSPERVTRLALLNTGVHPCSDAEVPGRQRLLDLAETQGMQAVMESWLPPMMSPSGLQNLELMTALRAMVLRHSTTDFSGQIQALLNRPEAESILTQINVPTLLLSGSEDNWSPISQHQAMQRKITDSTLVCLDGVGHMSTVESPGQIAQAFRDWLRTSVKHSFNQ